MYSKELTIMQEIAREAGEIMRHFLFGDQEARQKSDQTPLTIADTTINRLVIEKLHAAFPNDTIIGEEQSFISPANTTRVWFCDPIDGTQAYVIGSPTAMFSLALTVDGRPVVGLALDPFLGREYTAQKGEGAFCNQQPISVSEDTLAGGFVGVFSSPLRLFEEREIITALAQQGARFAGYSSIVHKACRVAEGRFVAALEPMASRYDAAAIDLIVHEAGGSVTRLDGQLIDYRSEIQGILVMNHATRPSLLHLYS